MSELEIIEGEVLPPAVYESRPINLFGDATPVEVVEKATEVADALAAVIESKQLYNRIGQRKHVNVEGWTLLGSMLGVFPIVEWTRPTEDGWEARVVARTRNGDEIGAAEAMCSRKESSWKNRDDYAIRSMAQTRAVSKALRHPLGFVMTLAGYEPTPEAEIPPQGQGAQDAYEQEVEQAVRGPAPLQLPTSWAEIDALLTAYPDFDEALWNRFGASARKLLFGDDDLSRKNKQVLFDITAGAALTLRNTIDATAFPPPSENDIATAWATQLDGAMLEPAPKKEGDE